MLRFPKLKHLCVLASVVAVIGACTNKKDEGTFDMSMDQLSAGGCLNLGNLYSGLHKMPSDAVVRSFTYDFTTANKDEDGSTPSSARIRILNRAAYFFSEGKLSEQRNTWVGAKQKACREGLLVDVYGNSTPFTIEEGNFDKEWVKVTLPDGSTSKFELNGPRSLVITAEEFRGSQCIYDAQLKTTSQTILRWGPASEMPSEEVVSGRYMRALSESVPNAPAALSNAASMGTDSISLATGLMREMNLMEVSVADQRSCPAGSKAPNAPPLPTATPEASPTPDPAATPAPEPTPEATPEPAPTP